LINKENALCKKRKLSRLKRSLKRDFIGIDSVIDSIVDYIGPWYVIPEVVSVPLVINLWGTTGIGKTDLIRRLSRFLKKPLIEINVGEFNDRSEFSEIVYGAFSEYTGQSSIILLDEFQNAKTILDGNEVERNYLRGIWRLLSDGTIQVNRYAESKKSLIRAMKNIDIYPKDRKEIDSSSNDFLEYSRGNPIKLDLSGKDDVYPEYIMEGLSTAIGINHDDINLIVLKDPANGHNKLIKLIKDSEVTTELNFRRSIIFIAGNLDDLYEDARNINPDLDINDLHDKAKKISIPDTKMILSNYFKPEQISRMGNNHLIYPFLSEKDFRNIISQKTSNTFKIYKENSGIQFKCDDIMKDILYSEGVYPTQGVRPLLSTIKGIIETNCQKFIFDACFNNLKLENMEVLISFKKNSSSLVFKPKGLSKKYNFEYFNELKIGSLRAPKLDDKHAMIAVHESGHAICHILGTGLYPTKLTAFSANSDSEGFIRVNIHPDKFISRSHLFGFIVSSLGGRAAELEFFGEDNLSTGSQADLKSASNLAVEYIEKHAFLISDPLYSTKLIHNEDGIEYPSRSAEKEFNFKELVVKALEVARGIVKENKRFILDLSAEILKKESLDGKEIREVMLRNNIEVKKYVSNLEILKNEASKFGIEIL